MRDYHFDLMKINPENSLYLCYINTQYSKCSKRIQVGFSNKK